MARNQHSERIRANSNIIRFCCPSRHRLRTEKHKAGKKARCPRCGQRFIMPDQTTSTVP